MTLKLTIFAAIAASSILAQPYNGSIAGSLTFTAGYSTTSGVSGFNVSNYITIPYQVLQRSSGAPGAYSARVKYTSCSKLDVLLSNSDGTAWWGVTAAGQLQYSGPGHGSIVVGSGLCDGNVHHVALSSTGSDIRMYIDGVQAGSTASGTWGAITTTSAGYIGTHPSSLGGYNFTGLLDEVAIWNTNRFPSAFSPTGSAYANSDSGLAALYHLETNAVDSASGSSLASGTLSAGTAGTTTMPLSMTAISGGTAPYSSQLQRASYAGSCGTFANIGSAVTGATPSWTDTGLTASTTYCWRVNVTDAASGAVTSNTVQAATSSASLNYTRVDATVAKTGLAIMCLIPSGTSPVPYNSANPTKLVIYHHGAGENQEAWLSDSLKTGIRNALLDAGYILCGHVARNDNWGIQDAVDDYVDLYQYVTANYNIGKVVGLGQSMGGLTATSSLAQGKIPYAAMAYIYPVISLQALHTAGTYTGAINTAHGILGGTQTYAVRTSGMDPLLIATQWPSAFKHVPMRFYASDSDTIVARSTNSAPFRALIYTSTYEALECSTANGFTNNCTGNHGDPSHFQSSDLLAFFNRTTATTLATSGQLGGGQRSY